MADNMHDCFDGIDSEFLAGLEKETGRPEWHALYTVCLGALIEDGVFDWDNEYLNWRDAAIDDAQYTRVCAYFVERYRYDEISMLPVKEWMLSLRRRLVYELMPKYKPLYARIAEGIDPIQDAGEYHKRRLITSDYPETLLSANSDYASDGQDLEYETIKEGNIADSVAKYSTMYQSVDKMLLDELEPMFISLYSANVNGL